MFDILLSHGYFLSEDEKEQEIMRPYPPMGILYLSAYLKRNDFSVEVFDSTFGERAELYARLSGNRGGILGLYTNLMTRPSVLGIIREAKKYDWTVIVGGPDSANYIGNYLDSGADFVVVGEGEVTLTELLTALKRGGGKGIAHIHGLAYLNGSGEPVRTPERGGADCISDFPWPDREAVNLDKYLDAWHGRHGETSVALITARGCPYRCKWCSHAVFGYTHRRREPVECADELEHIVRQYNPSRVWYADDVFTIDYDWLFQYARELNKRGLKVPFETISRADRMTDERVVDTLKEMGCQRIWLGAESCSRRLLDHMKRNVTVEQVYTATKALQKRGITVGMFLMWGYGDENLDDIDETVRQVARIDPDIFFTTIAYPIKGTAYFRENEERIWSPLAWHEGGDRDYRIQGRRSDRYYRYATMYLRNTVEAARLKSLGSERFYRKQKHARWARRLLEAAAND